MVAIGDAPNDEGLFDRWRFGLSVGTADVRDSLDVMAHAPERICMGREAQAFLELASALLSAR